MTQAQGEQTKQYGQIVAEAWADPAFKQRLLADPAAALAELSIPVPAGVTLQVHEATPGVMHLMLPPPPSDKLDLEHLDQVAGGSWEPGKGYCNVH